jgi:hypothetical protein
MRSTSAAIRTVAFVVAATFGWSVWVACAPLVPPAPMSHMACCKDGELTCASHDGANDCCTTDTARPDDAVANVKIDPVHTLSIVVAWAALPAAATIDLPQARLSHSTSPPPIEPGPPPYIAFSALLL